MVIFLVILIGLVVWAMQLLQAAIKSRDLSLALASSLVGVSAVGVVMVYVLMTGYVSYFSNPHLADLQMDSQAIPAMLYEPDGDNLPRVLELAGAEEWPRAAN
jgi:hypothetical protein